jgi:two-component system, sensor histidine kinase and response regulator
MTSGPHAEGAPPAPSPSVAARAEGLFAQDYGAILRRTDRIFAGLMVFQWVAAVVAALVISPRAWAATTSYTHIHVWAALVVGGLIAALPVSLAIVRPGRTLTRHVIAVGQMLTSALLIHLLGGRIETHFHVFGSLAFLAFYRDWRVLISATVVVALDHMLRGYLWPQSVYGVAGGAEWRWLEHAGWVAFEDAFLILSCAQGIKEMRSIALRQAEIETKNVELAESTRKAEAAVIAKGQFLANMSHEIRTPLNGVIGMTDLLTRTRLDGKQSKYVGVIRTSADALLSLISDILDFSKIEAGKLELAQADFDPGSLVEEVGELLASRAAAKQIELLCRVSPGTCRWARGDRGRLRQVLLNLGANAVKFTDRGEVMISVSAAPETPGALRFSIRDTGIGIAAERMDKLFQKFSQVDASNTRRHGGTGLGLAISKQLTEVMGGRIGVESEPGQGSTFWFEVPLGAAVSSGPSKVDAGRLRGLRVLIVDDNSTNRDILSEQCASWGFVSETAEDGPSAFRRFVHAADTGKAFDLAILDMQMPDMTGAELARLIKADPRLAATPLLVLSSIDGFGEDEGDANLFAARLVKPARASDLFDTIHRVVAPPANQPAAGQPSPVPRSPSPARRRALLAEDHKVNQLVAVEMLNAGGIECIVVPDGRRAVEAVRQGGFDFVLMDCQMPEMDGYHATSEIRILESAGPSGPGNPRHLPIIALTANAIKGDRERCRMAGMDGYVSKPIDSEELLRVIDELVPPKTARAEQRAVVPDEGAEPIDYAHLLHRCMGKPDIAAAVVDALVMDLAERLAGMESAAAQRNMTELCRIAHALKGAAANASAQGLRQRAAAIEEQARGDSTDLGAALQELRREIDRCTDWADKVRTAAVEPIAREEHDANPDR